MHGKQKAKPKQPTFFPFGSFANVGESLMGITTVSKSGR